MADRVSHTRRRLLVGIAAGSVTAVALTASKSFSGSTTYQYDDFGRVVKVNHPSGTSTCYTYDAADNRTATQTAGACTGSSSSSSSGGTVIQVSVASNLRSLANAAGYTGAAPGNYQFEVASGVTIMGAAGSGRGIDTGTWPAGSTLTLVVNGNLYGGGGSGGNGANMSINLGNGYPGGTGGDAVYAQAPITITVNSGGSVRGGGGAGQSYTGTSVGGDGGGGGFPNGAGGTGSSGSAGDPNSPGSAGTTAGGGNGGAGGPAGGKGGNAATSGNNGTNATGTGGTGGAAGYAARKNGQTVTVTGAGTVTGTVA